MAIRGRTSDSDNIAPELEERKIVYVDTSLDTCLGITISESVTVSDLKKKMVMEHMQLCPEHGEIMVHRVKVKRRGKYYFLPDMTIVSDVIPRGNRCEFLFADCSGTPINYLKPKSPEHGESGSLRVELGRTHDDYQRVLSCDVNKEHTPVLSLCHGVISEMMDSSKVRNHGEKKLDSECSGDSVKHSRARKKLKMALNEIHQTQCLEGNDSTLRENEKDKSMVDSYREVPGIFVHNQREKYLPGANDEVLVAPNVAREIGVESNKSLENHVASDSRKDDTLLENVVPQTITADKSDNELGQNAQVKNLEAVMAREPDPSVGTVDSSDKTRKEKSSSKKKRKKGKDVEGTHINMATKNSNIESDINSQDALHTDRMNEGVVLQNETSGNVLAEKSEKEHGQSDRVDCEEVVTVKELNLPAIDNTGAEQEAIFNDNKMRKMTSMPTPEESVVDTQYRLTLDKTKEDTVLCDGTPEFMIREFDNELGQIHPAKQLERITIITCSTEGGRTSESKKKREKKRKAHKEAGEIQNTSNLQHEIGKAESIQPNTETLELDKSKDSFLSLNGDKMMRLSGIKTSDVSPNLLEENVSTSRKKRKKGKRSGETNLESGSVVVIHSAVNHVLEETRKDVPSNFIYSSAGHGSEKIQNVDENMANFVATQILSKEVMGAKNETCTDVSSDSTVLVKDNLEVNQIEDSGKSTENKVEKAKKKRKKIVNLALNVEANLPRKNLKTDADVLATNESLTSIRNSENTGKVETANTGEEVNYAQDFVTGQSNHKVSVLDSGSALKCSSITGTQEKLTIKKQNEPVPVSSYVGGTSKHLDKSSSERSDMFPENARGKRRQTDLVEKVKLVMRPPQSKSLLLKLAGISQDKKAAQKKSLLAKAGSIFKDHSDEESTDENGSIFSNANSGSSDSSSDSDDENGYNGGKGGSNGGKSKSRFDLSAIDGMTIDKLLRSSSQYKKAKLQASQSDLDLDESQPIESIPYTLANP